MAGGARAASTAIYYLLRQGELSRWHRIDAAETCHWYARAPPLLSLCEEGRAQRHLTVAPGFEFAGFDLAPEG